MHISDGILSAGWCGTWFAASAPFVAAGLKKLKKEPARARLKPLLGMVGAAVFVVSCMPIPVPTAGTCSHPAGTPLAAILVGPLYSVLAATASLILQALFLSHGGISTLGANVFSMGVVGSFAGYGTFKISKKLGASVFVAAFFGGLTGDWMTYLTTSTELSLALHGQGPFLPLFIKIALGFIPTQLPLGILEGFLTAGAVKFLMERKPDAVRHLFKPKDIPVQEAA